MDILFHTIANLASTITKPYPTPNHTFFDIMHLIDTLRYAVTNRDTIEASLGDEGDACPSKKL